MVHCVGRGHGEERVGLSAIIVAAAYRGRLFTWAVRSPLTVRTRRLKTDVVVV